MRHHAGYATVIFGAMFPLAVCAEIDPTALLDQARAKIGKNMERLPKYTCVQTVQRFRFETIPAIRPQGCRQDPQADSRLMLFWADRLKLDVTVSAGAEIFSWIGARRFQSGDVDRIVGGGMTGTGDFGPFLGSVFFAKGVEYRYLGLQQNEGRAFMAYHYRVPLAASRYQAKVGPRREDLAAMAYEGTFWVDPENAELGRMTIEVPQPPAGSRECRVESTIDYRRVGIGDSDLLLPRLTVLKIWDTEAERFENHIEYSGCRAFQAESVFRTDLDAPGGDSTVAQEPVAIPPGIGVKIALRSIIDSENSFAGDAIDGELLNAVWARGKLLVPAGAIAHGRIVRFERQYQPSNYFALGLKFDSIEVHGTEVPLTLAGANRSKRDRVLAGAIESRQGVGIFMFQAERLTLDRTFVSEWKTAAGKPLE
jgi:hypothetical protein